MSKHITWAPSFDADWANSGLTRYFNTAHPERVSIVDDPILGPARKVARLEVHDTDLLPTANPRAQLEPPYTLNEGAEAWLGFGLLLPDDFPLPYPQAGWNGFVQVYGPPFAGSPPWGLTVGAGSSQFKIGRNSAPIAWRYTAERNRWFDFALHTRLSSDPTRGFLELWLNTGAGWEQQTFTDGSRRLIFATLDGTNNGGANTFDLSNYRQVGVLDVLTVYFAGHRIGRSLAEVDPHSY